MIDRACISLNAKCNLKCIYCHFAQKKNNNKSKLNEFSNDEIKLFCSNLYTYIKKGKIPSFKLGIVGAGEPLLSFKQLKTIVKFFYNSDIKNVVKIYTISNGTLLSKENVNFFYKYKDIVELNISLDGNEEINRKLRGFFPDFSNYENIFLEKPKINSVVTKDVIKNKDKIISYFVENKFKKINFSKVFATKNPSIAITDEEYKNFLLDAQNKGIISRQNEAIEKYDCSKYGKLCGVGKTNIFITKTGIYPCGRFMDLLDYKIGDWNDFLGDIEIKLREFKMCPKGECYYEYYKVGE